MPLYALAILCGSLLSFYGGELPDPFWSALVPLLLLLAIYNRVYRFSLIAVAACLWSSALLHHHLQHRLIASYDHKVTRVKAIVADMPEIDSGRIRLYLKPLQIDAYPAVLPRLMRVSWYQDRIIPAAGETWSFEIKLRQPRGLLNPGAFDYEAWQFVRGIDAGGYIRDSKLNRRISQADWFNIDHWRAGLAARIDTACAQCRQRSLIKALIIGYRGDIAPQQQRLLQASGTAHLIAISGLHIGLLGGLSTLR